ncbi:MAG TPA: DUF1501 domain-containing protein [Gemmataceae bacterium]
MVHEPTTPVPENPRPPSGRPSRRDVLRAGCVGALGLMLPELLAAGERGGRARSCVFIHQYGGLSQLDSWDPKPNGPAEIRGPYRPIATATPGFRVGELMPNLARVSNLYAVIRSMSHTVPVHDIANQMLLAGSSRPAPDAPALGSIVAKLRPPAENVPPYVWLQKFGGGAAPPDRSYLTGGFLGMPYAPLVIGHGHDDNPAAEGFRVRAFDTAEDVGLDRLETRMRLLGELEGPRTAARPEPQRSWETFRARAFDLLHGARARRAFDVSREPPAVRDRYGRNPLGQNLLLARRLIEAGVRLVSVVAWTGLAPGEKFLSVETWDMHGNAGIGIFENGWNGLGWALPRADRAVAALLEDLRDRGLLDSTLVVLVGEFGRTPKISKGAKALGRDHWPRCYSAMLAGAGIRGGAVYGASDEQAAYVKDRPVSPEDFGATLLHALDIDPATRLSPDGFTRPASTGQPILDLFG